MLGTVEKIYYCLVFSNYPKPNLYPKQMTTDTKEDYVINDV